MSERQPKHIKGNERQDFGDESNLGTAHDPRTLGERALAIALRELGPETVAQAASNESSMRLLESPPQKPSNNNDSRENNETMDIPLVLTDEEIDLYREELLAEVEKDLAILEEAESYIPAELSPYQLPATVVITPITTAGYMVKR